MARIGLLSFRRPGQGVVIPSRESRSLELLPMASDFSRAGSGVIWREVLGHAKRLDRRCAPLYIVHVHYTMREQIPVLQIDLASPVPASEQIVRGLRATLLAGQFRPGDQLPSVRQLAVDLDVHHNTVAGAYRQLAEEGWLDLRRGRGATVIERPAPAPTPRAEAEFRKALEEVVVKALAEGVPLGAVSRELTTLLTKLEEGERR